MAKQSTNKTKAGYTLADKLWGDTGPYSQVRTVFETRILDDAISRVFVNVEVDINPATFEYALSNRDLFKNDKVILDLLDHSDYRDQEFGYVSSAFSAEFTGPEVLERAKVHEAYSIAAILKLHRLVMAGLGKKPVS